MNQFSIILPVRNGGNYVKECIYSILNQTYQHFNLIVLDNNSSDGTKEWIKSLNNPKIIIYPSTKNLNINENWARAVNVVINEFITLIGHDDLLQANYLEEMNLLINKYPKASLYQSHFNYINKTGNFIRHCKSMDTMQTAAQFLECHIDQSLDSMGTGYMMRSKDFIELGGMPQNYPALLFADYELWIKLMLLSFKATSKKILFSYRIHNSTSKITDAIKYQDAFLEYIKFLSNLKNDNTEIQKVIDKKGGKLLLFYCTSLSHRLLQLPKSARKKTVIIFVNECINISNKLLGTKNNFRPYKSLKILLAILVDNNKLGRYFFSKYRNFKYNNK